MNWDDEGEKPKLTIVLGADLERFTVAELDARIVALESEISRVRAEIAAKKIHAAAAAALFDE